VVTFRLFREKPPLYRLKPICLAGNLDDVITYAKFEDDIFREYDFTGGRISYFPNDFCMGLTTVQRYCAACVMEQNIPAAVAPGELRVAVEFWPSLHVYTFLCISFSLFLFSFSSFSFLGFSFDTSVL